MASWSVVVLVSATLPFRACGGAAYMTEVTTTCVQKLMADAGCCKDQEIPFGVQQQIVVRKDYAWTCEVDNSCVDSKRGPRGIDMLWYPKEADCSTPRVLFVHGGGWKRHGPRSGAYDVLAAKLARVTGASILMADYPLVPVGTQGDIQDYLVSAWEWLSQHGPGSDGADCSLAPLPPMFLAGDSSGAATALALLLKLSKSRDLFSASGFFAFSPWLNLDCDTPTFYSNSFAIVKDVGGDIFVGDILFRGLPTNNSRSLRSLALAYVGGRPGLLRDEAVAPFHAPLASLTGLPPMYIAVSGSEILGGDGIIFANKVARLGVPVNLDIFPGMWHGFEQHSEGCGSGKELWQGGIALSHAGDFVTQVTKFVSSGTQGHLPQTNQRTPRTSVHYPHPENAEPWAPIEELVVDLGAAPVVQPAEAAVPAHDDIERAAHDVVERATTQQPVAREEPEPQLSLVAPRALPLQRHCSQETLVGAALTGVLGGSIFTFFLVTMTTWFLSRRAHGELPTWLPKFLAHPLQNFQDEQRNGYTAGYSEDERLGMRKH
eukprot:TRINITY_DN47734_c0_g1_i1.p1 TRINITY_DN47734_c0_g1~~TRINITY_DN47734_c0_g1_i1.p1  ORF type:complete len:558 (+),score=75.70 TRINITY_DN47734_c0_g1_i1:37-1674(+)